MKSPTFLAVLSLSTAVAVAQTGSGMAMSDADMKKCEQMMGKAADMKDMHAQCVEMMKSSGQKTSKASASRTHQAVAVVKEVDAASGKVVLDHGAVKSLQWPAMTMSFLVKDKKLFDKLTVGKKVKVKLKQQGPDYVVTAVS